MKKKFIQPSELHEIAIALRTYIYRSINDIFFST